VSGRTLFMLVVCAAVFLILSSADLPPVVASHFAAGGAANAFMPRTAYVGFMVGIVAGLPLLITVLLGLVRRLPPSLYNLPNSDYWLAPERIEATRQYMARQAAGFTALIVLFLSYVHWLVVQANLVQPPQLAEQPFILGLALFALATIVWAGGFIAHFMRTHG
jgi:uncharacterized membrane protein